MSLGNVEEVKRTVRNLIKKFDYDKRELNQPLLKKVKDLIKRDAQLIPEFVDTIFINLKSQDSDKRLCIVLLVDYFFNAHMHFELQLLILYNRIGSIIFSTTWSTSSCNNPKKETLQIFKLWVEKYVSGYPKLENAKTVLLSSKTFDFARSDGQTEVERKRAEEEKIQKDIIDKKIIDQILIDFAESKAHVKESVVEAQTMISLIVPDFREYQNVSSPEAGPSSSSSTPTVTSRNLVISVPDKIIVEKNDDNEELINAFKDNQKLLGPNLKKVNNWISKMTRHGGNGEILKEMLDLQRNLNQEIQKTKDVKIIERRKAVIPKAAMEDGSEDDEDSDGFEDVDLNVADPEGLGSDEERGKKDEEITVEQELLEQISEMEKRETLEKLKAKKDEPSSSKKKPEVPTLNYGLDLKYWGEDVKPAEVAKNQFDGHRFWRPPDEDQVGHESEDVYRTRVITFVGEMPEITHSCRAPLPSGRLCPRMDRVNCPLHGPIIDRDENGVIVGVHPKQQKGTFLTANQKFYAEYERKRKEDEEDALYRELEKQTDGKFSYQIAKGKKKKKDAPKKREKSAHQKTRDRLSTKILNKRSLKRVTDHLDAVQKNKAAKKFAHQFNY
uniref:UV-stimulated scaffold protein A n=1 Tax=Panagrolaimus superbus TaxID=310955 RepID=A0A914YSQ6_9BILA